jgi:hypothetical protein
MKITIEIDRDGLDAIKHVVSTAADHEARREAREYAHDEARADLWLTFFDGFVQGVLSRIFRATRAPADDSARTDEPDDDDGDTERFFQ